MLIKVRPPVAPVDDAEVPNLCYEEQDANFEKFTDTVDNILPEETSANITAESNQAQESLPILSIGATVTEGGLEHQADDSTEQFSTLVQFSMGVST